MLGKWRSSSSCEYSSIHMPVRRPSFRRVLGHLNWLLPFIRLNYALPPKRISFRRLEIFNFQTVYYHHERNKTKGFLDNYLSLTQIGLIYFITPESFVHVA